MPSDKSRFSISCLFMPSVNSREYFRSADRKHNLRYAHQLNINDPSPNTETTKKVSSRFTS